MEDQIIELEYQIKDLEKKIDKILTILKNNMGSIQTPLFLWFFSKNQLTSNKEFYIIVVYLVRSLYENI